MGKKVYLSGTIAGITNKEASEWRNKAKSFLNKKGFKCINPLTRNSKKGYGKYPSEYVTIDKYDINRSDIILANIEHVSVGTSMEIIYAYEKGKIVLPFGRSRKNTSVWIKANCTRLFSTLEEALEYIKDTFGGKVDV